MEKRRVLAAGDLPRLQPNESQKQQMEKICGYLFKLREDLVYLLQNLTEENWNKAAMERLQAQFAGAEALAALEEKVAALEAALAAANGEEGQG